MINCLIKKSETVEVCNQIVLQLKTAMLENLRKRFGRMEKIQLLSIATILDPRFKTIHSNDPVASFKAIRTIKFKILDIKNNCDDSTSNKGSSDDDYSLSDNLWSVHNELVSKKAASENFEQSNDRIPTDLKHYLSQPTIPLNQNIFKFWEGHSAMYP